MWIVRLALDRPYTFIVLALLILILSPVVILGTPTDIFPNINIPVVSVVWTYTGLNPEEMEGRLTTSYERVLTTVVDNIQHIESTSYNGLAVVKIFLQPGASLDTANAQVTACSQFILRQMPPGTQPPIILNFSASSVPILQLGLSGSGLSEQDLNDLALNFLRPQLITVPGAVVPYPYGGKQREIMINLNPQQLQAKGLAPSDVLSSVERQYLVLPSGTVKLSQFEYDVHLNGTTQTVDELNNLPIKDHCNATIYLRDVATVSLAFAPQTNIVRQNGRRGVLMSIIKAGNASTISVVDGIHAILPRVEQTPAAAIAYRVARRSVDFRQSLDRQRDPRGGHRRRAHRPDDPTVPRQLALDPDHRRVDPAVDPDLADGFELPRRDDQHHDPRRTGPGGRHPCRRCDGDDRKYRALYGRGARPARCHPQRRRADRCAGAGFRRSPSASSSCRCSCSTASRATFSCPWPRPSSSPCSPLIYCRAPWCRRWPCIC